MSHQKLLKRPARLLLIALVATASTTVPLKAAIPRASRLAVAIHNSGVTNIVKTRTTRSEFYPIKGIERWGLNE